MHRLPWSNETPFIIGKGGQILAGLFPSPPPPQTHITHITSLYVCPNDPSTPALQAINGKQGDSPCAGLAASLLTTPSKMGAAAKSTASS